MLGRGLTVVLEVDLLLIGLVTSFGLVTSVERENTAMASGLNEFVGCDLETIAGCTTCLVDVDGCVFAFGGLTLAGTTGKYD